ncbi:hypothetical protein LUZ63_023710 [Rhynchospora breviuscula]|uniref:Uncharacterized protein n=1 Tax=Rhynchospora breviuscula TaxID=2022672 RepID=A0A9P9Z324_9POAL|nr:hypothetical protein LUZ63_023710 [Rhynchospora breviuscula]
MRILTTLMANYVAADVALFLVNNYFRDPSSGAVETPPLDRSLWLWAILPPSQANIGVVIALVLVAAVWIWSERTRSGDARRRVGHPAGLRGIPRFPLGAVPRRFDARLGRAGGARRRAGRAGRDPLLHRGFSPQYGFLGITVAMIGRLRPLGIVVAGALYASLITGATAMQSVSDVPFSLVFVLQGVLILLITSQRIGGKASS